MELHSHNPILESVPMVLLEMHIAENFWSKIVRETSSYPSEIVVGSLVPE
jgi:hypothetical protein